MKSNVVEQAHKLENGTQMLNRAIEAIDEKVYASSARTHANMEQLMARVVAIETTSRSAFFCSRALPHWVRQGTAFFSSSVQKQLRLPVPVVKMLPRTTASRSPVLRHQVPPLLSVDVPSARNAGRSTVLVEFATRAVQNWRFRSAAEDTGRLQVAGRM